MIAGIFVALLMIAGVFLLPSQTTEVSASAEDSFVVEERMERVRKILVRTNSVKTIVVMANAEMTDQEWLKRKFDGEGSLPDRNLNLSGAGEGRLEVQCSDYWLGKQDLILEQKIRVQPQRLQSAD